MDHNTDSAAGGRPEHSGIIQSGSYSSQQKELLGVESLFLFLAIVAVTLRFWSRRIKGVRIVANDVVALVALVTLVGFFALMIYGSAASCIWTLITHMALGVMIGMGRNLKDLQDPQNQITQLFKLMIPLPMMWSTINTLVKLSLLDLYVRVFPAKSLHAVSYILMGACFFYWLGSIIFPFVNCRPFSYLWDMMQKGSCAAPIGGALAFGVINLVLDVVVIVLPLPYLYKLQLKLSKRISLIGIFALGFVITAISALRVHAILSGSFAAFSRGAGVISLWSFLETALSVINCCFPVMQPALLEIGRSIKHKFVTPTVSEPSPPTHKFVSLMTSTSPSRAFSPEPGASYELSTAETGVYEKDARYKSAVYEHQVELATEDHERNSRRWPFNSKGHSVREELSAESEKRKLPGGLV